VGQTQYTVQDREVIAEATQLLAATHPAENHVIGTWPT